MTFRFGRLCLGSGDTPRACPVRGEAGHSLGAVTGLVYLAIIALWVVFLIPWLGRHRDEQGAKHSADRYQRAMDTLARARQRPEHPVAEDEPAQLALEEDTVGSDGRHWRAVLSSLLRRPPARASRAARRRRQLVLLLSGLSIASLGGAATGMLPGFAAVACVLLLSGYVAAIFRVTAPSTMSAPHASAEADRYRQEAVRAQAQARAMLQTEPPRQGWEPVPATLPTYVTKPRAPRVPRVVEIAAPKQEWTGEALVDAAQQERRKAAQHVFEQEIRAVEPDQDERIPELADPTAPLPRVANG